MASKAAAEGRRRHPWFHEPPTPPPACSTRAKQQTETGRIVNLMSTDVNQLMTFFYPFAAQLVTGPAMLIASIVLLWFQIK